MPFYPLPRVSHPQEEDPESKRESLTHLYNEKALRYGIVFDELIRQVAVHSMALATLVGKVNKREQAYLSTFRERHLRDICTINLGYFLVPPERGDYSKFYLISLTRVFGRESEIRATGWVVVLFLQYSYPRSPVLVASTSSLLAVTKQFGLVLAECHGQAGGGGCAPAR